MPFMPSHRPIGPEVRAAIAELCTEYVFRLDNGYADQVTGLFTEDASWEGPHGLLRGREDLDATWRDRVKWPILTRHMISNIRLAWSADDVLHGWVSFTLFRADKGALRLPNPMLVAEHIDTYANGPDGAWRFQTRRVSSVFYGREWSQPKAAAKQPRRKESLK